MRNIDVLENQRGAVRQIIGFQPQTQMLETETLQIIEFWLLRSCVVVL